MQHTAQEVANTIIADILREPELQKARTFSELHDYCDANVLGNQEQALTDAGFTGTDDGADEKALGAVTDLLNEAQDIVDRWLRSRDPKGVK